jgi:hypothetical protein
MNRTQRIQCRIWRDELRESVVLNPIRNVGLVVTRPSKNGGLV